MVSETDRIPAALRAAMRNMQFLRYNIPLELADVVRPLSSEEAKKLQNLHMKFSKDEWTEAETQELTTILIKSDERARLLEQILDNNGYIIATNKEGVKRVASSKSPLGKRINFTWQFPGFEEYDGGLLSQQSEEEFLQDVMAGKYDDKYTKDYLSDLYPERELREGVSPTGNAEYLHYFLERNISSDLDEDEDNTNISDLSII